MGNEIKSEWTALLSLLGCHLNGNDTKAVLAENEEIDIDKIIVLADKHKVLPLIYDIIIDKQQLTPYQHSYIQDTAKTFTVFVKGQSCVADNVVNITSKVLAGFLFVEKTYVKRIWFHQCAHMSYLSSSLHAPI